MIRRPIIRLNKGRQPRPWKWKLMHRMSISTPSVIQFNELLIHIGYLVQNFLILKFPSQFPVINVIQACQPDYFRSSWSIQSTNDDKTKLKFNVFYFPFSCAPWKDYQDNELCHTQRKYGSATTNETSYLASNKDRSCSQAGLKTVWIFKVFQDY